MQLLNVLKSKVSISTLHFSLLSANASASDFCLCEDILLIMNPVLPVWLLSADYLPKLDV